MDNDLTATDHMVYSVTSISKFVVSVHGILIVPYYSEKQDSNSQYKYKNKYFVVH